jgi:hypothetical protein
MDLSMGGLDSLPELFTAKELRNVVFNGKASKNTVYALIHSEGFPLIRVGERGLYISRNGLKKWIEEEAGR